MSRRAVTLVECLVVLAIFATLCGLLVPAFMAATGDRAETLEPRKSWNLYTAQHDGHWFVKDAAGGVCHHPDCPCNNRTAEAE